MKTIVTGGAGFIGSHLVDRLIKDGHEVLVVDNLSTGLEENISPKAECMLIDLTKRGNWDLFNGYDYVFHLAALPRIQYSIDNPYKTFQSNVKITAKVLEMARKSKVKRVIYSSSSSVYGIPKSLPIKEKHPKTPISPYSSQKYMSEILCNYYSRNLGLDTVSLRYFNVYGPRQSATGAYKLVVKIFLEQKAEGKSLTIYGDGKQTRDFTHVSDVVEANILAMDHKEKFNAEAFNVGTGAETSINRIAGLIGGDTEYITPNPRAEFEEMRKFANNKKIFSILGWLPQMSIENGIQQLLEMEASENTN